MPTITLKTRLRPDGTLELRVPRELASEPVTKDGKEFTLEHYGRLRESFLTQGTRLWTRFNYLLAIQAALVGVFLTREGYSFALPLLGACSAALWYVVAAQDVWFYQEARERLRKFTSRQIVPKIPGWSNADESAPYSCPRWRRAVCFRIPRFGVAHFAPVFPLFFVFFWILLWTGVIPRAAGH
jgi:hypothetical protein